MIIYTHSMTGTKFATKGEAVADARATAHEYRGLFWHAQWMDAEIEKHTAAQITKDALLDILNSDGGYWSAGHEVIGTVSIDGKFYAKG